MSSPFYITKGLLPTENSCICLLINRKDQVRTEETQLQRRPSCSRRTMQLVVMVTMLAVAVAGRDCFIGCHLTNFTIDVESCGSMERIHTTMCAGQCFNNFPVYISPSEGPSQKTCNGEWSYEVKHFRGCPIGVTYAVARSCKCSSCDTENTSCDPYNGDVQNCMSY